jgi:glycosyltransferase involved in cell wall biosynthesis
MAAKHVHGSAGTHLVNPLWDGNGGADWRTVDTWRLLRPCGNVHLWSEYTPAPQFASILPVRRIAPLQLQMPFGGTIVFVGVYFRVGHWIRFARPDRVVILYNTDQPDRLAKNLRRIAGCGRRAEVVASSHALARRVGLELPLLESPIDLSRFLGTARPARSTFTVGRLSRDVDSKHHDEDPALYRLLAAAGCRVRIMGGTCLASKLAGIPNIELLPAGAESAAEFLKSLDCFVYRTSARWFEGFGRVVFESMASGLPVVCSTSGGYFEYLRNGHDCLLFGTTAEAAAAILRVRADPALRRQLGAAAIASASTIIGSARRRTMDFLLAPSISSISPGPRSVMRRTQAIAES